MNKSANAIPAFVPGGTTQFLQPLHISTNHSFTVMICWLYILQTKGLNYHLVQKLLAAPYILFRQGNCIPRHNSKMVKSEAPQTNTRWYTTPKCVSCAVRATEQELCHLLVVWVFSFYFWSKRKSVNVFYGKSWTQEWEGKGNILNAGTTQTSIVLRPLWTPSILLI